MAGDLIDVLQAAFPNAHVRANCDGVQNVTWMKMPQHVSQQPLCLCVWKLS